MIYGPITVAVPAYLSVETLFPSEINARCCKNEQPMSWRSFASTEYCVCDEGEVAFSCFLEGRTVHVSG